MGEVIIGSPTVVSFINKDGYTKQFLWLTAKTLVFFYLWSVVSKIYTCILIYRLNNLTKITNLLFLFNNMYKKYKY